ASLTETLFSPTSIASSLIDYGIKKHTGKKVSEHALSKITDKDCELSIENLSNPPSICKDKEVVENNNILTKSKTASQRQSNKSSLVSITPKLKAIPVEATSKSNEVYLLTLNQVLNKDFNSLGLRRIN
ncbi:MAG: hypothetical protein ACKPKO_18200, partial [Candidatus Fonsibacter sp.]